MALLERVATLLRANLNDLLHRAEDPEKLLKQFVLDLENQLLQVKTQLAIALADQHHLERRAAEQKEATNRWQQKASLAVAAGEDDLAREALQRALEQNRLLSAFEDQLGHQGREAAALRTTYTRLQSRLVEVTAKCDILLAQQRRARLVTAAVHATIPGPGRTESLTAVDRIRDEVLGAEAAGRAAKAVFQQGTIEDRLAKLEQDEQIEKLLRDLKVEQRQLATGLGS